MANVTATPTIGDRSYGIVALRYLPILISDPAPPPPTSTNTQVLLIRQKTINHDLYPPFWSFPKGHAEHCDASLLDTAIREFHEETGLTISPHDVLTFPTSSNFRDETENEEEEGKMKFIEAYQSPIRKVGKEVRYWPALLKGSGEGIKVQEAEVVEAKWCGWGEAQGLLSFEEGRAVLRAVWRAVDGENGGDGEKR